MPYIKQEDRKKYEKSLSELSALLDATTTAGDLNYLVTCLAHAYVKSHGVSYRTFNDVVGALEGAKLELYRRGIAPYEDKKIIENGDV